jgi:uncharacterized protein (DUF427 family)
MTSKAIKVPGPEHPITVEPNASRVVVSIGGRIIADSREALTLREANYPPVQYIPRKDVDVSCCGAQSMPPTVPTKETARTTAFP